MRIFLKFLLKTLVYCSCKLIPKILPQPNLFIWA
ncbi:hypothetical protein GLYMA_01G192150v4 [Glycine max]|nr:hypothetical protein GLYMA_01G192150v4 [Glycine max]KAH1163876.1 hypothetical protein GYH30_002082 [Glycine max]